MNRLHSVAAACLVFAACLVAPDASALKVRALTLPDLVRESAAIVVGSVTSSGSVWNEAHDTIYTDSVVAVEEVLASRPAQTGAVITVRQPGGTVGDTRATIAGVRYLEPGQRVLLFLRTDGVRHYLVGFSQGVWYLAGTPERPTVSRSSPADLRPGPTGVPRALDGEPWSDFKARVTTLIAAQAKKAPAGVP